MTTTRRTLLRATAGLAIAAPAIVRAQAAWPAKPVTIVVNFPAGGLTDGIARAFGQHVQQATGQQVIIDNKPGASGNIGAALVARAPADGYTFLHSVSSTLVQNRAMFKTMGFDPDKDLTIVSTSYMTLEALQAQLDTATRMDEVIRDTRDRSRLQNARMDESVARAIELSVKAEDVTELDGLGDNVGDLVTQLDAMRQALDDPALRPTR